MWLTPNELELRSELYTFCFHIQSKFGGLEEKCLADKIKDIVMAILTDKEINIFVYGPA